MNDLNIFFFFLHYELHRSGLCLISECPKSVKDLNTMGTLWGSALLQSGNCILPNTGVTTFELNECGQNTKPF